MNAQNQDARHAKIFGTSVDEQRTKRIQREVRVADSQNETEDAKLARVRRLRAKRASSAKNHRLPNIQMLPPLEAMQVWLTEIAVADLSWHDYQETTTALSSSATMTDAIYKTIASPRAN